jgi:hypothetical protein
MTSYNPYDWYWLADDGRVYGTKNQRIVDATDASYVDWSLTKAPTEWPRDLNGNQTEAELQATIAQYPGLFVNLKYYAADKRWRKEQGGITLGGLPIATDDRSKQMIMGARIASDVDPEFTTQWVADGNVYPLTSEQIIDISNAVLTHVASCFATFATVSSGIDDGTITTTEEIDAAFAS